MSRLVHCQAQHSPVDRFFELLAIRRKGLLTRLVEKIARIGASPAYSSAHFGGAQSRRRPKNGHFWRNSENNSLSFRLSGGGRSLLRTRLCPKIPVNREKYRENANALTHQGIQNIDSIGIFRFFFWDGANS